MTRFFERLDKFLIDFDQWTWDDCMMCRRVRAGILIGWIISNMFNLAMMCLMFHAFLL